MSNPIASKVDGESLISFAKYHQAKYLVTKSSCMPYIMKFFLLVASTNQVNLKGTYNPMSYRLDIHKQVKRDIVD